MVFFNEMQNRDLFNFGTIIIDVKTHLKAMNKTLSSDNDTKILSLDCQKLDKINGIKSPNFMCLESTTKWCCVEET